MYLVREINSYNKTKVKVKLDSGFTFALYKGEIRKYNIKVDAYISEEIFNLLINDILYKRARERALYLLQYSAKTEKQIKDKLKSELYPEEIIQRVLSTLKKYNYLNDYDYVQNYLSALSKEKSKMEIRNKLLQRGVAKDIIDDAILDANISDDDSLRIIIKKKATKYDLNNIKDKNRFYSMLLRKGYTYDKINKILRESNY